MRNDSEQKARKHATPDGEQGVTRRLQPKASQKAKFLQRLLKPFDPAKLQATLQDLAALWKEPRKALEKFNQIKFEHKLAILIGGAFSSVLLALCILYYGVGIGAFSGHSRFEIIVPQGSTGRSVAMMLAERGASVPVPVFLAALKLDGKDTGLHAGKYRFDASESLHTVVRKLSSGEVAQATLRIPDGITIWQLREIVETHPDVEVKTMGLSHEAFAKAVGIDENHPEGLFFPDTYVFNAGSSDISIYRTAYRKLKTVLRREWSKRAAKLKLKTPYEALILASIIEKETGLHTDRFLVSSVFHNRLRIWMPLQTDPTIIYSLGEEFSGRLRKRDLIRPNPYNSYINYGLPPTPIAMPSQASIHAALHPAQSKYLYFVARGDGTTQFSSKLIEHNVAVDKYQKSNTKKKK